MATAVCASSTGSVLLRSCSLISLRFYTTWRDRYDWVYTTFSAANSSSERYLVQVKKFWPCVHTCVGVPRDGSLVCRSYIPVPDASRDKLETLLVRNVRMRYDGSSPASS